MPKKNAVIREIDKTEIDSLEMEKSRIAREKSKIVLNKGLVLYFAFLAIGVMGFSNKYLDSYMLNVLVISGILVLIISTLPYVFIVHREEKWIHMRLAELRK
jgi:hypothetical protein